MEVAMKTQFIGAVSTILLILFFSLNPAFCSDEAKCECDFDTTSYTAECDCSFACAVVMKEGKHCSIVCDGEPKAAAEGNMAVFGTPKEYLKGMAYFKDTLFMDGFSAFNNPKFSKKSLPMFVRSAYIGAEFISPGEKKYLDDFVYKVFSEYEKEIWENFTNKDTKGFEKQFPDGKLGVVKYKGIKLGLPGYSIKFFYQD